MRKSERPATGAAASYQGYLAYPVGVKIAVRCRSSVVAERSASAAVLAILRAGRGSLEKVSVRRRGERARQ